MSQYSSYTPDRLRFPPLSHPDTDFSQNSDQPQNIVVMAPPHWQHLHIHKTSYSLPDHPNISSSSNFPAFVASLPVSESGWTMDSTVQPSYGPLLPVHDPAIGYPTSADYPESSQRTALSSSPTNATPPSYHYEDGTSRSQSRSPDHTDKGYHLYTMDETEPPASPQSSSAGTPLVKTEQTDTDPDSCFVMEISAAQEKAIGLSQSMAPQTEASIRATNASEEMRKMMGRFRIDPFAIHNGEHRGVVASWCGGKACPLEEEPQMFEFQIPLVDSHSISQEESPSDLPLDPGSQKSPAGFEHEHWDSYGHAAEAEFGYDASQEWNVEATMHDEHPPPDPVCNVHPHQHEGGQERRWGCGTQDYVYFNANTAHGVQRVRPQEDFWSSGGVYHAPSRSSTYGSDSPGYDVSSVVA
ncbi:hypothetical protein AMATHDRAFT_47725 [Amanita thiersii Skay4041]|uniref:Uncharacterized protein n=1 Tax=Amanita thiersii Skay4041 TaxID=703135 RepID=A0A2A9NKJ0_9AGAR|nr:hypothetical protein AMATHDRAFT_47725 [Amanita thiersii Skay4041]